MSLVHKSCAALFPAVTSQSMRSESILGVLHPITTVVGCIVIAGGVLSIRTKVAEVVSKLLHPSPAINMTGIAALQVSPSDGLVGLVVQKIELQSSVAVAPPCVAIQVLKIWVMLG